MHRKPSSEKATKTASTNTESPKMPDIPEPKEELQKLVEPHVKPNSSIDPLFSLLLITIHLLWKVLAAVGSHISYVYHLLRSRWEEARFEDSLRKLPNIPKNVALAINTPELDLNRLAQLISWCRSVPTITTVTIYHPYTYEDTEEEGGLGSLKHVLLKKIINEEGPLSTTVSKRNQPFKVAFLPFSAGRQSLVEAAKYFATSPDEGEITPEAISAYLNTHHYPHPDPELLLLFGDARIFNGFPCWQIRLTETVFLPPLRWLTLSHFHQALQVYSKCEQRFGL